MAAEPFEISSAALLALKPGADPRSGLAVLRTELALDRTQLAWVRTAFTFITAGFAIDKATTAMHEARMLAGTAWVKNSHFIGLTLISCSTLFLVLATMTYVRQARQLAQFKVAPTPHFRAAHAVTCLVLVLGTALCILLLTTD